MSQINRITQSARRTRRTESGQDRVPSAWRAEVTEVTTAGAWLRIPRLTGESRHGPVEQLEGLTLEVGDRVLVVMLSGRKDEPVVVGRLA